MGEALFTSVALLMRDKGLKYVHGLNFSGDVDTQADPITILLYSPITAVAT